MRGAGVWGTEPWHPPMLLPCDPGTGYSIDQCHTMETLVGFAGPYRVRWDLLETCPACGHVRVARIQVGYKR